MSHKEINTSLTESETGSVQLIDQEIREVKEPVITDVTSLNTINNKNNELVQDKETDNDTTINDNKELLIDLGTEEGYQYSVDFDREKYLEAIREKDLLNTSIRPILIGN